MIIINCCKNKEGIGIEYSRKTVNLIVIGRSLSEEDTIKAKTQMMKRKTGGKYCAIDQEKIHRKPVFQNIFLGVAKK